MTKKLPSERVVVSAPMSFSGSAVRIWKITDTDMALLKLLLIPLALVLVLIVWSLVFCWYMIFGLWVVPYRLLRRSSRKNKRDQLRHQELIEIAARKTAE